MSNQILMDQLLSRKPLDEGQRGTEPWKWVRENLEIACVERFTNEVADIRRRCRKRVPNPATKVMEEVFDGELFTNLLIMSCTPDIDWKALKEHYGEPELAMVPQKLFYHNADYDAIGKHCFKLCGLGEDGSTPEEQVGN